MELMDFSLEAVKKQVYESQKKVIPEGIIGRICLAVSSSLWFVLSLVLILSGPPGPEGSSLLAKGT